MDPFSRVILFVGVKVEPREHEGDRRVIPPTLVVGFGLMWPAETWECPERNVDVGATPPIGHHARMVFVLVRDARRDASSDRKSVV